jgi:hypothetical protein
MSRFVHRLLSILRLRRPSRGGSLTSGQQQVLRANLRSLLFTKETLSET